jgi:hypothetical protein
MITKEQFTKAILYLGMTYNKEIQQGTIQIWYEFFKDGDINTLMRAIKNISVKSKFLPSVAELVEECKKIDEEFKYVILQKMFNDGYFKRCVVGEQSPEEEMIDYNKALFIVGRSIIPEWLEKDMISYGYKKPISYNPTERLSDNHKYLIE